MGSVRAIAPFAYGLSMVEIADTSVGWDIPSGPAGFIRYCLATLSRRTLSLRAHHSAPASLPLHAYAPLKISVVEQPD
jgi:hypothetical protein